MIDIQCLHLEIKKTGTKSLVEDSHHEMAVSRVMKMQKVAGLNNAKLSHNNQSILQTLIQLK